MSIKSHSFDMIKASEIRIYNWTGIGDRQGCTITVVGGYFEAIDQALMLFPSLTRDDIDNPNLFKLTSAEMAT
jgi:hypothetical protein